ncbi:MAG TPA: nickel transporter, partial [Ochrobactrum intermedium]|nr:nickel transporter [Brucella intermedia]
MDFALMQRVLPFFLEAAWVTVQISALALILGLAVAAIL